MEASPEKIKTDFPAEGEPLKEKEDLPAEKKELILNKLKRAKELEQEIGETKSPLKLEELKRIMVQLERFLRGENKEPEEERQPEEKIEKLVDIIERGFEKARNKGDDNRIKIIQEEILPKIPSLGPGDLQRVIDSLLERYKDKEKDNFHLGWPISYLINRTVNEYVQSELKKGKKMEEIKDLTINLDLGSFKNPVSLLGEDNLDKSHLIIKGGCDFRIGGYMKGGEIEIEGDVEHSLGEYMTGGRITVRGNADVGAGSGMQGGEIEIFGNAGIETGRAMRGGKLIIHGEIKDILGEVKEFDKSAFSAENKGEIWHKGKRIWPVKP